MVVRVNNKHYLQRTAYILHYCEHLYVEEHVLCKVADLAEQPYYIILFGVLAQDQISGHNNPTMIIVSNS